MKKAVLSLSGGLDSTCLLLHLLSQGYEVKAYSFYYGQKHSVELEKVMKNIAFLQQKGFPVTWKKIDLSSCFDESNSSLHLGGEDIPSGHYASENMKSTVVENRNVIFASIIYGKALSWANRTNDNVSIFLGIHAGDHTIYPDCRPESQQACEHAFKISNWGSERVFYEAPFVDIDKAAALRNGLCAMAELGLSSDEMTEVLRNTHTCYNPDTLGRSCGVCGSCRERLESFSLNGLVDPIEYVPLH